MKKRLIAVLICAVLLCGCDIPTSSNLSQSGNTSQSETDTKVYTIDEFCKKFDDEKNFSSKHSNEFFTITGEIEKDSDVLLGNIDFKSGFESTEWKTEYRLTCKFENRDDVDGLGAGDVVTIKGKLFSLATSGIVLQDCTLISTDKKNDNDSSTDSLDSNSTNQTESTNESTNGTSVSEPESSSTVTTPQQTSSTTPSTPQIKPSVVYIAATGEGTKYHKSSDCSGMNGNVIEMTREEAEAAGYTPCKKKSCYG